MKKYLLIICAAILLSGCDKLNDVIDRFKEKTSWVYAEEIDKLNNSKIYKTKKEFKNPEGSVQSDVEFQCNSEKSLTLQISTYQTKEVNGKYPGASLVFNSTNESDVDFVKSRTGENKIAFPILSDKEFNNIAKISLTGINMVGISGLPSLIKMMTANVEISGQGYKLAVDGKEIQKFFKTPDWVIEVPTESGKIIVEVDLTNKNIQKVLEVCMWKPEFLNTLAPAAAPQASAAAQSTDSKSEPVNTKASSTINDSNIVAFVNANLTSENVVINQPLSLAIRGNLMTADGDFKFLHSYTKTQLPNNLQNVFILCMSSIGIDKLANEATARVLADKFMVMGVSPNGEEFRISADQCEITNPV